MLQQSVISSLFINYVKKSNLVTYYILLVIIFFSFQANAQQKIDSLEHLLTTQISASDKIKVELDLINIYFGIDPKKATEHLNTLEPRLNTTSNKEFLTLFYIAKSIDFRMNGLYEDAKNAAQQALTYSNQQEDSIKYKAEIYYSLGAIADDESNIQLAIEHHLIALRYAEEYNDVDLLATVFAGIGRAYMYLSEYDIAKEYYLKAISIKELNSTHDMSLVTYYTNLSNCFDAEGIYDTSLYYLDKSIELSRGKGVKLITSYNNKAYTLLLMNKLAEAETAILLALSTEDSVGAENEYMYPYSTYAEILFAQNRLSKAEEMMKKSIEISRKYNDLYLAKYNLDLLYNIYLKKEKYKLALEYYQQKSVVMDSIYNVNSRKEIEKLALEYETEKKNKAIELLNKESEISAIELKKSNQLQIAFLVAAVLILIVLALLWIGFKNKIKRDALIKKAMELDFEKQLAFSEMQALRAQMNPHFLFNCLNSINSFIIKNDQEQATEYLSKFSKLIRRVLSNSKSSKVTLTNELEALELYIALEALRFNKKFEYKIIVDSDVEVDFIEIPPLIIQPFVENSIWHGIMHKTDGIGTILIEIKQEGNTLVSIIEDNGIGRETAMKLKSESTGKRKSYGMSITEERLKYINHKFKATTNIKVIDLKNEEEEGCGTRVVIKIGV